MLRPSLGLGLVIAFEIVVFVVGQRDFVAADPLWYAQIAKALATAPHGVFHPGDIHPHVMRIGLTVPLSLVYRAVGVSTLTTNLPNLLAVLVCVAVVYAAAPNPRAKLIACALCAASATLVAEASLLSVDLPSTAMMALCVLCLQRRRWTLAMIVWFAGFLVKESALWCAPVWLYAIGCEARADGLRIAARRFAPAIGVGLALAAGYLALCSWLWHDPLARFHGIDKAVGSVGDNPSYAAAWVLTVGRMTWEVPNLLVKIFGGPTLFLVAVGMWLARGRDRIWPVATAMIVLLYWFGSSELAAYTPLPISIRLALPVVPFALATAAIGADALLTRMRSARWRLALVVGFGLVLAVATVRIAIVAFRRQRPETAAFAALRAEVRRAPDTRFLLVCGEPRCLAIWPFYFGLERPANLAAVFARDFAAAPLPPGVRVRALVNVPRGHGAARYDPALDLTGAIDAVHLPPIALAPDVRLYDAGDGAQLHAALAGR